ncbi:MAG: helix-turn-helix domain-containing protein [Xanthomonadales bacterium]|nr:helix-turn-helix domain-containing protein [Xanthomonadales bacterium]
MSEQAELIPLSPGTRLGQRREKKRQSVAKVSKALRIDEAIIRAIEADTLGHLAPIYRRGYIRQYAKYLGFKPDEIDAMVTAVDDSEPELHTVFPEANRPDSADRMIRATSYVLASLLVGTLAWQFSKEALRISGEVSNTAQRSVGTVGVQEEDAPESGQRHVNASIASLERIRPPAASGAAAEQAWSGLRRASGSDADGHSTLELTASGDSWVEISDANGQQLEMDLVRGGSSKHYQGKAPFTIQFGRASAISLKLNGEPVDLAPHTDGDVTQMILRLPGEAPG